MASSGKQATGIGSFLSGLSNRGAEEPVAGEVVSESIAQLISEAILDSSDVVKIIRMHAVHLSATEVLVGAKIDVAPELTMRQVSVIVNLAERRVRAALAEATQIFITPDVWIDPEAAQPTTSAIVLRSGN